MDSSDCMWPIYTLAFLWIQIWYITICQLNLQITALKLSALQILQVPTNNFLPVQLVIINRAALLLLSKFFQWASTWRIDDLCSPWSYHSIDTKYFHCNPTVIAYLLWSVIQEYQSCNESMLGYWEFKVLNKCHANTKTQTIYTQVFILQLNTRTI